MIWEVKVEESGREARQGRQSVKNTTLSRLSQRVTKLDLQGKLGDSRQWGCLSTRFLGIG